MKETLRDTAPGPRETTGTTTTTTSGLTGTTGIAAPIDGIRTNDQTYDSTVNSAHLGTGSSGLAGQTHTTGLTGTTGASGLADQTAPMASSTHGTASTLPSGHGTGHGDATQSVVDRLNANIQASVREKTGAKDLDVAEEQPKTSTGKRILEGLGLGGDERKTTLKGSEQ